MTSSTKRRVKTFIPQRLGRKALEMFGAPERLAGLNSLAVGAAVFELEQAVKAHRIDKAILPIYRNADSVVDTDRLADLVRQLLVFTLVEDIEIAFREFAVPYKGGGSSPFAHSTDNVCLFSGGTDSYAGLFLYQNRPGSVEGLFCAHSDQARMIHIVKSLTRRISREGIQVHKQLVPKIGARGYAQLRGFLYLTSAAAWLHALNGKNLIVTECGPTMYQPRFSPVDAITMTTHPFVVSISNQIIDLLLGRRVQIVTPFENLTKAEVIAISPTSPGLRFTHSCVTQRFGNHDGTCYGCVLRRLATIATGREDVHYLRNPIADQTAHAGNLLSLLTFCDDILTRYGEMEEYEIGIINHYGKRNLFIRFAQDNFAAIHRLMTARKTVQRAVRQLYESVLKTIGADVLEARIAALQAADFAALIQDKPSNAGVAS